MEFGFDLHVHSTFSDGMDTPAELLQMARRRLSVLSVCDHDTLGAYDSLFELHAAEETHLTLLPGVELSSMAGDWSIHVLGYFPSGFPDGFRSAVKELEDERRQRVMVGVERLRSRGVPLRWKALEESWGEGVPCRSHVARALIRVGLARSTQIVFSRYLRGDDFPQPTLSATAAVELILDHGGLPVWAHPPIKALEEAGGPMAEAGLRGIEVYQPRRSGGRRRALLEFASRHSLFATGGTDHHGLSPRRKLGWFSVPRELFPEELGVPAG